jgi:peptidoglycan/LPS O-acetylase OafA/YrhL
MNPFNTLIAGEQSTHIPKEVPIFKATEAYAHLDYLDGLRGLAALYVVLSHISLYLGPQNTPILFWATRWMPYGRTSVSIFIVLSGYCLMMPLARSADGLFKGGFPKFAKRRARRILPPYYAALALALLLTAFAPQKWIAQNNWWQTMQPSFSVGNVAAHIALVHNLNTHWIYRLDGPMWSVAMEWQIYFIFALILLPTWRRFGLKAAVPLAFGLGLAPLVLLHRLEWTSPWYIGLFSLGMAGAVISFSAQARFQRLRQQAFWNWSAPVLLGLFVVCVALGLVSSWDGRWKVQFAQDVYIGGACLCLLVGYTQRLQSPHPTSLPWALRVLQSPPAVRLGAFSYSLYLVHALVLVTTESIVHRFGFQPDTEFLIFALFGVSLSLLISYGFHLLFEKPFMNTPRKPKPIMPLTPTSEKTAV